MADPTPRQDIARAKVNLYLRVTGRRADGYHLLDSLVVFADAKDIVTAGHAENLTLDIRGGEAVALTGEPDNLVLRAARALAEATGRAPKAAITLTKLLPVASGIGGGSADALVVAGTAVLIDEVFVLTSDDGEIAGHAPNLPPSPSVAILCACGVEPYAGPELGPGLGTGQTWKPIPSPDPSPSPSPAPRQAPPAVRPRGSGPRRGTCSACGA